ncbi:hypothetical protein PMAYCL1PPCAC_32230, partial [Pristionchus mayeri]
VYQRRIFGLIIGSKASCLYQHIMAYQTSGLRGKKGYESNDVRNQESEEAYPEIARGIDRAPSPSFLHLKPTAVEKIRQIQNADNGLRNKKGFESNLVRLSKESDWKGCKSSDVRVPSREQSERSAPVTSNRSSSYREPEDTRDCPESSSWSDRASARSLHHHEPRSAAASASVSYFSPAWLAPVSLTGLPTAEDDRVNRRAKFIRNSGWDCIESGRFREKLQAALPRALPVQEVGIAAIQEGLDLILRAPRGYGRTTSWAVPIIDNIMGYPRERGKLHTLVVAASDGTAHYIASGISLLIPREKEVRILRPLWHWKESAIRRNYDDIQKNGGDILITTSKLLPSLLVDAAFDMSTLQTLVFEEIERMPEAGNPDWVVKVCSYLHKTTQTMIVGDPVCSSMDNLSQLLKTPFASIHANQVPDEYEPMTS